MPNNDLITKLIEVSDITEKAFLNGKQAKIKDQDNLTYTVWQKKKDGSISAAWASLERVGLGSNIQIGYVEEQKEYEGKPYTARTIRTINEDIGNGMANAMAQGKTSRSEAPVASETPKDDKFWEKQAYEKCCSRWAGSLLQRHETENVDVITYINNGYFWERFQTIKADGKKRFFADFDKPATAPVANAPEKLPTIQAGGEDISVEDIPF